MHLILRWAAISGFCLTNWVCLALSAMAQPTPPPGVTIPPTAPDAVEQTVPKPAESPLPLPSQAPILPPQLELQTPPAQELPEGTPPSSNRFSSTK